MTGIYVDDINEKTSAHGVEIDGVTLKDGGATFTGTVTGIPASAGASLVLLKSGTPSGADTGTTFDDFYSSDYEVYLVQGSGLETTDDDKDITARFYNTAGSVLSTGDYTWIWKGYNASTGGDWSYTGTSATSMGLVEALGNASGEYCAFSIWLSGLANTNIHPNYNGTITYNNTGSQLVSGYIGGQYNGGVATTMRGLQFLCSGAGFTGTGIIRIYGVKK
jgi:hypothetical protein